MPDNSGIPVFAVVGHPNEGKSSIVSTLSEDDTVRVAPEPGTTRVCRAYPILIDGVEIIRFVDTPGFQSPRSTLAWFKAYNGEDSLLVDAFLDTHGKNPEFFDECELLSPIDSGAGIGAGVLTFAAAADQVVVVTSPEPPAITDAYALIKVLCNRQFAGQVGLVVNLAANRQQARLTYHRIADVASRFLGTSVAQLGYVLADSKVPQAVQQREPLVLAFPRSLASRCLATVANRLSQMPVAIDSFERQGFFGKVVNWFM